MILETERLIVRKWRECDVSCYMTLAKDVGYNCFSLPGQFLVSGAEEAKGRIRERMNLFDERKLGKFPVFLKQTEEFIGTCGLAPYNLDGCEEVELGYRLCLKYWGKGYAKEAAAVVLRHGFEELNLQRVIGFAIPQNKASLKILEELGFQYLREIVHAELPHRLYEMSRNNFVRLKTS